MRSCSCIDIEQKPYHYRYQNVRIWLVVDGTFFGHKLILTSLTSLTQSNCGRHWNDPRRPDLSTRAHTFPFFCIFLDIFDFNLGALSISCFTSIYQVEVTFSEFDVGFEEILVFFCQRRNTKYKMWGQWLAVCFLKGFLVAWQGNIQWKVDSNPGVISFASMHSLKNSCKTPATLSTNQMQNHNKLHTLLAGVFPRVRQFSYGFLVWFFSVMIGCCDYFGFGLVILSWSTLYWNGWGIVMQLLTFLNISTVPSLISSISFTTEESVRFCGTVLSVPSKTRWWRLGLPVVRRGHDSVMIACQIWWYEILKQCLCHLLKRNNPPCRGCETQKAIPKKNVASNILVS